MSSPVASAGARSVDWKWLAALAVFFAAFSFMVWRGPARALGPGGSSDFSLIWESTRSFLDGQSPYEVVAIQQTWEEHSGTSALPPSDRNAALFVYPPSTFVLMSPWCCTDWASGRMGWMLTGTAMLVGILAGCLRLAGLSWRQPVYWLAMAGGIAMAPGHTGISVGQTSIAVMFLIVVAQLLRPDCTRRGTLASLLPGVALGLACAIKPQIGLVFLALEAGRGRWKAAVTGLVVAGLVLTAGILKLRASGVDWYPQWQANLAAFAASDNADPSAANPLRYQLINLSYLLHGFTDNRAVVKWLVYTIVTGLCGAYFLAGRGKPSERGELLSLSFLAAVSMLVVYHRLYDALVLLFPLAWLFSQVRCLRDANERRRVWGICLAVALCLLPFYVPGASLLNSLKDNHKIAASIAESWWFNALIMPHAVSALMGLALCMILARDKLAPSQDHP